MQAVLGKAEGIEIVKEAKDHTRVTPEGQRLGIQMAKIAQRFSEQLRQEGEHGECCKTCAFRGNTVPNGCLQTQMDAYKAVMEGVPFLCHQQKGNVCHGWFAARQHPLLKGKCISVPYEFSEPDPE